MYAGSRTPPARLAEALAPPGIVAIGTQTTAALFGGRRAVLTDTACTSAAQAERSRGHEATYHRHAAARSGWAGRVAYRWRSQRMASVAWARTGALGAFSCATLPRSIGSERVRLRFAGDARDLPARRALAG